MKQKGWRSAGEAPVAGAPAGTAGKRGIFTMSPFGAWFTASLMFTSNALAKNDSTDSLQCAAFPEPSNMYNAWSSCRKVSIIAITGRVESTQ